jgi:hypothetical protein
VRAGAYPGADDIVLQLRLAEVARQAKVHQLDLGVLARVLAHNVVQLEVAVLQLCASRCTHTATPHASQRRHKANGECTGAASPG